MDTNHLRSERTKEEMGWLGTFKGRDIYVGERKEINVAYWTPGAIEVGIIYCVREDHRCFAVNSDGEF